MRSIASKDRSNLYITLHYITNRWFRRRRLCPVSHPGGNRLWRTWSSSELIFLKRLSSISALNWENERMSGGAKADFEDFLRNESILCWSSLFANPDQAGDAYNSLDIIIELNIVWMDWLFNPCALSIFKAYSDCAHCPMTVRMWSEIEVYRLS